MHALKESDGALSFVADWWRNLRSRRAAMGELNRCGDDEADHIARDIGVSSSELRTLAGKWPNSADLLSQRIAAVGLKTENVRQTEPRVLQDLQRVCTLCAERARCEHDLDQDPGDRVWRGYCPNVATLDALRSDDRDRRLMRRSRKWRSF